MAQYQSPRGDVAGYVGFVRELVAEYGAVTATLQITEEPNVTGNPVLDGDYPRVSEAIIAGVTAAKQEARSTAEHEAHEAADGVLACGLIRTEAEPDSVGIFTDLDSHPRAARRLLRRSAPLLRWLPPGRPARPRAARCRRWVRPGRESTVSHGCMHS